MHRHLNTVVATAVSFVAISTVGYADGMPPDIAEKIAALGRVIAVPQTDAIYAPLHPMDPYPGVNVTRDVRYGPADLNVLDVFTAENAAGGRRPVLVLVHGGGFSVGTKKTAGSPFLDNIPLWAAHNGRVRLLPSVIGGPWGLSSTRPLML